MKINQCKTEDDIQEYYEKEDKKIQKEFGFVYGEMDTIKNYCRRHHALLSKCGDRMTVIKKTETVQKANRGEE